MEDAGTRAVRWFVGLCLVVGGFALLGGALQYGSFSGAPYWVFAFAAALAILLSLFTAALEPGPWSPTWPAAAWIVVVLLSMLWAHFDAAGHAFLSGFAAIVAFGTGLGILRRQLWAWPVAFANVVGFGPIVLLIAPIPATVVAAGFLLFLADTVGLLALQRSYFESR